MIPNGFYSDLDGIAASDIEFVCYGMLRSGSTLVYQLISEIYKEGVAKTHKYSSHLVKTVVSYRDFRDVAVSLWRRIDPKNIQRRMNQDEVRRFAKRSLRQVDILDRYFERKDVCHLRYELFVNNPQYIFSSLSEKFNIVFEKSLNEALCKKYSLDENKRISEVLGTFERWDEKTQIHGNHIYQGKIGGWRDFVDDLDVDCMENILGPSLVRYGYSV
ncbi:MAG TPA: hypothetical protein VK717_01720 [Opitutaceae bacterium]|jgi:hypothetical protein|nr:hypothetical protein [Opitutaceae bacterium]